MKDKKHIKTAIGLMSGTSADGVDVALLKTDGSSIIKQGAFLFHPYSQALQTKIKQGMKQAYTLDHAQARPNWLAEIEQTVTTEHILALEAFFRKYQISPHSVDVIGLHGQTMTHHPDQGWTMQIGNAQQIADHFKINLVSDFRTNDMKHGGQGAPLVPVYHAALVADQPLQTYAILNLGGVGNVTWIDYGAQTTDVRLIAFDTGPANALLDDWLSSRTEEGYDKEGRYSAFGKTDTKALKMFLDNPYFTQKPPKSLDRDHFSLEPIQSLNVEDGASTLVDFTVATIQQAMQHFPKAPDRWFICGGGVHNKTLMRRLRSKVHPSCVAIEDIGFNSHSLEAQAFAFLAVRKLYDLPVSFPSTTGCEKAVAGGIITKVKY